MYIVITQRKIWFLCNMINMYIIIYTCILCIAFWYLDSTNHDHKHTIARYTSRHQETWPGSAALQASGLWALGRLAERLEAPGAGMQVRIRRKLYLDLKVLGVGSGLEVDWKTWHQWISWLYHGYLDIFGMYGWEFQTSCRCTLNIIEIICMNLYCIRDRTQKLDYLKPWKPLGHLTGQCGSGSVEDAAQRAKQLHPDSALVQRHAVRIPQWRSGSGWLA